jgi:hypothetical protein
MAARSLPARTFEPLVFAAWGFRRAVAAQVVPDELVWVRIGGAAGEKLRLALQQWEGAAPTGRMTLHPNENGTTAAHEPRRNAMWRAAFIRPVETLDRTRPGDWPPGWG